MNDSSSVPPSSSGPVKAAATGLPPRLVIEQKAPLFGRFGKILILLLFVATVVIVGQYASYQSYFNPPTGPQEKYHSLSKTATKKIAIVSVTGAILTGEGFVKDQLDRVRKDDSIVGVVLRVDSPGGTVTGSDYLYHHIKQLREELELPMVVSMGSLCASGGYYIAMAVGQGEDLIFAEPTTWTGSIGVVIPHYDLAGLLASWNVEDDSIASHPLKLLGSPTREMTAEDREILQQLVDDHFLRFKNIVRSGRAKLAADDVLLNAVATGQIFSSDQALENHLVDRIGFIEAAIARVTELAEIDPDSVRCVKYERPLGALDALLGTNATSQLQPPAGLASLLDLAAPRAYYLCSWLPSVMHTQSAQ